MTDVEREAVEEPEHPVEPRGPLLRDPPLPPGYTNPVEESELLEEPFGAQR